jgi:uncharacterized protein YbjT (DUF2867 family)
VIHRGETRLLLTGANGRTGRAVLQALEARGAAVRAFVRDPAQADGVRALGADDVAVGDMQDGASVASAVEGCDTVIHIGPPMHPGEVAITARFVDAALANDVGHFVYYSVMHPFRRDVRHHSLKLDATEALVDSGVPYTVLEPSRYMQHLEPIWSAVRDEGVHAMPFGVDQRFSVVDLLDLAETTATVATEPGHLYASYELAGPEPLSQNEMAATIGEVLGREVTARRIPLDEMAAGAAARGIGEDRIAQMRAMNAHYDAHGFLGNPNVLTYLLNREPTSFRAYVERLAAG